MPFEFERSSVKGVQGVEREGEEEHAVVGTGEEKGLDGDGEWHAEIEIQGLWPARTSERDVALDMKGRDLEEPAGMLLKSRMNGEDGEMNVAGVPLQGLRVSTRPHGQMSAAAAAASAEPVLSKKARSTENVRSKAENRLLRKQRRVLQGTWGPKRVERMQDVVEEKQEEDEVDSVLSRIEAMKGPSVQKKTTKRAKAEDMDEPKLQKTSKGDEKAESRITSLKSGKNEGKSGTESPRSEPKRERENWQIQKSALANKFGTAGWQPHKKLSPDTISGIKALHASDPASYSTATLSQHFEVSPEAIRRILRSKWRPSEEVAEERRVRWEKRGVRKWAELAEKGVRPPKKWRDAGVQWEAKGKGKGRKRDEGFVGRRRGRDGEDQAVGMLSGIEAEGLDERIL